MRTLKCFTAFDHMLIPRHRAGFLRQKSILPPFSESGVAQFGMIGGHNLSTSSWE